MKYRLNVYCLMMLMMWLVQRRVTNNNQSIEEFMLVHITAMCV
jgi:hypothetical protein